MALHPIPTKQLDPTVMEEGEDAALLGSGGASNLELATADGAGGVEFLPPGLPGLHAATHSDTGTDEITVQDLGSGVADAGDVLASDGAGGLVFTDTADAFVKKVGGTSPDFADISAALAALETAVAKNGILLIGAAFTPWGSTVVTLTKPVTFIGTVEGAGFNTGAGAKLTIDMPGVDEAPIEFENIELAKTAGDDGIDFAQSAVLKFRKCLINNRSGEGLGLFRTLATATNGNITVFAEDTDFVADTPVAPAGDTRMFLINDTTGNFEAHLKNCTWFNDPTANSGSRLIETAGGNVDLFLSDGTVLHRPGILTDLTGNLTVHYKDGSSLVTDFVSGGLGLANLIGGTTTVHGEETYTTDMDALSSEINMERVLQEYMSLALNIGPGTFSYTAQADLNKPDVTIRGAGQEATILSYETTIGSALSLNSTADRNTIEDLKFKMAVASGGSGSAIFTSGPEDVHIRNITVEFDVNRGRALNLSSLRAVVENVHVKSTTTTARPTTATISVIGADSVIRGCFIDHTLLITANQAPIGIDTGSGARIVVENNRVVGNIGIGIKVTGDEVKVTGNYIDQGDVDLADRTGVIAISCQGRDNFVEGNYMQDIGEFGIRIPSNGERSTIIVNHVKGGKTDSIGIDADVVGADNIIIKGNTVENGVLGDTSIGTGIKLTGTGAGGVRMAVVRGNTIERVLAVGIDVDYTGVTAGDTPGPIVSDNDIIHATQPSLIGIRIRGLSTNPIVGGMVNNNKIFMGTNVSPGDGITVQFVTDFSVNDNHLEGRESATGSNGIEIDDSKECQVNSNRILGFENGIASLSTASGDSTQNLYAVNHLRGNVNATTFAANETDRDELSNKE